MGADDGTAAMWSGPPDVDSDGDGMLDGVGLDFDGDGARDDALADLDGDGLADHAVLDLGGSPRWFTDDGTGTWALPATAPGSGGPLRWLTLDGVEHTGGPLVDLDDDGSADDRLLDVNGDGLADRAFSGAPGGLVEGYVDIDGDGHWDVRLADTDGDGAADAAAALQ